MTGAIVHTFEASVMGNAGVEYGLALYYRRGDVVRLPRLLEAGRRAEATKIDTLVMALGEEPAFTAAALEDAIGLPRVPVPMRIEGGRTRPVTDEELLVLVAAVRAVAKLSPEMREATGEAAFDEMRTVARVRAPAPAPKVEHRALSASYSTLWRVPWKTCGEGCGVRR